LRLLAPRSGLGEPLVCKSNRTSLQIDLSVQLVATTSPDHATARELAFSHCKLSLSRIARLHERASLLLDKPPAHLLIRAEHKPFDLRARLMLRA
jgi:hypothetical protein